MSGRSHSAKEKLDRDSPSGEEQAFGEINHGNHRREQQRYLDDISRQLEQSRIARKQVTQKSRRTCDHRDHEQKTEANQHRFVFRLCRRQRHIAERGGQLVALVKGHVLPSGFVGQQCTQQLVVHRVAGLETVECPDERVAEHIEISYGVKRLVLDEFVIEPQSIAV